VLILDPASVFTVRLTRQGHPFDGQDLRVLGRMRRHGTLELILELPDGSKSMMPAAWTDHPDAAAGGQPAADGEVAGGEPALGRVTDFLELTVLVSSLLARGVSGVVDADIRDQVEGCPTEEDPDADPASSAEPAVAPAAGAARGGARRRGAATGRGGRVGGRPAGPADRGSGPDRALFEREELG